MGLIAGRTGEHARQAGPVRSCAGGPAAADQGTGPAGSARSRADGPAADADDRHGPHPDRGGRDLVVAVTPSAIPA